MHLTLGRIQRLLGGRGATTKFPRRLPETKANGIWKQGNLTAVSGYELRTGIYISQSMNGNFAIVCEPHKHPNRLPRHNAGLHCQDCYVCAEKPQVFSLPA